MSEKSTLLLFSGGLDSTHMLHTLLEEGPVDVLSFRLLPQTHINPAENQELEARAAILEWLRTGGSEAVKANLGNVWHEKIPAALLGGVYNQLLTQMAAAVKYASPSSHSGVAMAYLADDSWAFLVHHIEQLWQSLYALHKPGQALVPLNLSMLHTGWRKQNVLEQIHPELAKRCSWCEDPPKIDGASAEARQECGLCDSCITYAKAKLHLRLKNAQSEFKHVAQTC